MLISYIIYIPFERSMIELLKTKKKNTCSCMNFHLKFEKFTTTVNSAANFLSRMFIYIFLICIYHVRKKKNFLCTQSVHLMYFYLIWPSINIIQSASTEFSLSARSLGIQNWSCADHVSFSCFNPIEIKKVISRSHLYIYFKVWCIHYTKLEQLSKLFFIDIGGWGFKYPTLLRKLSQIVLFLILYHEL